MKLLKPFPTAAHLIVLTTCFITARQKAGAQGKLQFDSTVFHFGANVRAGDTLTGIFHFTNTGPQPVTIQKVGVPCDCTVPGWTNGPIAAGQRGQIKIMYHTGTDTGAFRKQLQVVSDAAEHTMQLAIEGTVAATLEQRFPCHTGAIRIRQCASLDFGELLQGESRELQRRMINTGSTSIKLSRRPAATPFIHVSIPDDELPPGNEFTVALKASPGATQKPGLYQGTIIIDAPGQEVLAVPFTGRVMERFTTMLQPRAHPSIHIPHAMADAGSVTAGHAVTATFEMRNTATVPLRIRAYDAGGSKDTRFFFSRNTTRPQETLKMKVIFDTTGKSGNWTEMLYVHTNFPDMPLLRFSVQMNILPGQQLNK